MLDKLNNKVDKPGVVPIVLGVCGLAISFIASKFSQRDMTDAINDAFEKNNRNLKGG